MAVNLVLHPMVGALAVALVLAAFATKVRKKFHRLHYVLGSSALVASAVALVLGLRTVLQANLEGVEFEETLTFHLIGASALFLVLLVQAGWGLAMWRWQRQESFLSRHRALGRILALLAVIVASLGAITFFTVA